MKNILVYVDHPLAISVASKLVGVLRGTTEGKQAKAAFNWLISASVGSTTEASVQQDIRELLPEDLVYLTYEHIDVKASSINDVIAMFQTPRSLPGRVISVEGTLAFPDVQASLGGETPASDVDTPIAVHHFHGVACIRAFLQSDRYRIPVYFLHEARYQVLFCHNSPVEVTGVLRWVPPYSPSGGQSLNLALQCAALWMQ